MNCVGHEHIDRCPAGLTNAQGQLVQRCLILGGPANGGLLAEEKVGEKFSLYAWDGSTGTNNVAAPQKLIEDLRGYALSPEGVALICVAGHWRVLFVEDRSLAGGYGTRNAVHWPVSILGSVE